MGHSVPDQSFTQNRTLPVGGKVEGNAEMRLRDLGSASSEPGAELCSYRSEHVLIDVKIGPNVKRNMTKDTQAVLSAVWTCPASRSRSYETETTGEAFRFPVNRRRHTPAATQRRTRPHAALVSTQPARYRGGSNVKTTSWVPPGMKTERRI